MNIRTLRRGVIPGVLLSLSALGASLLPILNAGRIAALLGANEHITAVFTQLHHAHLRPAYLLLLPGALVLSLTAAPIYRARLLRRTTFILITLLLWLLLCAACFLMLEVNFIPVHASLSILIDWIKGGILNEL